MKLQPSKLLDKNISPALAEQQSANITSPEISDIQGSIKEITSLVKFGKHEIPSKWAKELEQFLSETMGKVSREELENSIKFENNEYKVLWTNQLDLRRCKGLKKIPIGLEVEGHLLLQECTELIELPEGLKVRGNLDICNCTNLPVLPNRLQVGVCLFMDRCSKIKELPSGLQVGDDIIYSRRYFDELAMADYIPSGTQVSGHIYCNDCLELTNLPEEFEVKGNLFLNNCPSLTKLPNYLNVGGSLYVRGCTGIRELPAGLKVGDILYLEGCTGLRELPTGLKAKSLEFDAVHSKLFTISQLSNLKEHLVNNLHWQITGDVNITIPTFIPHIESGLGKGDIEAQKDLANQFQVQQENITPQKIQETLALFRWTEDLIKEGYEDILNLTADETDESKIKRFLEYRSRKDQILNRLRSVISKPLLEAVKEYTLSTSEAPKIISFLKLDLAS